MPSFKFASALMATQLVHFSFALPLSDFVERAPEDLSMASPPLARRFWPFGDPPSPPSPESGNVQFNHEAPTPTSEPAELLRARGVYPPSGPTPRYTPVNQHNSGNSLLQDLSRLSNSLGKSSKRTVSERDLPQGLSAQDLSDLLSVSLVARDLPQGLSAQELGLLAATSLAARDLPQGLSMQELAELAILSKRDLIPPNELPPPVGGGGLTASGGSGSSALGDALNAVLQGLSDASKRSLSRRDLIPPNELPPPIGRGKTTASGGPPSAINDALNAVLQGLSKASRRDLLERDPQEDTGKFSGDPGKGLEPPSPGTEGPKIGPQDPQPEAAPELPQGPQPEPVPAPGPTQSAVEPPAAPAPAPTFSAVEPPAPVPPAPTFSALEPPVAPVPVQTFSAYA